MPVEAPDTCPECRSENIQSLPQQSAKFVCSDCGFVIGDLANTTTGAERSEWSTFNESEETNEFGEKRKKLGEQLKNTERNPETSLTGDAAPKTTDEWRMWYPCPECESVDLNQITEQHLSVSATKDGSYGGETGSIEEYDYIECSDCGEVLLDQIGRDEA